MRSIIAVGMVFRSTLPSRPVVQRRPLTSTKVRSAPRLRRLTPAEPSPPLLKVRFSAAPLAATRCRMSATEVTPCFSMSARVRLRTGCEVSISVLLMREPVTEMRSRLVASCAWAVTDVAAPAISATTTASRSLLDWKFIGSLSPRNLGWGSACAAESKRGLQNREAESIVTALCQKLKLC
ncbi:hypothetical protein D3C71_880270 [compost metagenome]